MHRVLVLVLSLGMIGAANAACTGTEWLNGKLHAYCTDETTGHDFEYVDLDGHFDRFSSRLSGRDVGATEDIDQEVYAWYDSGVNTSTAVGVEKRLNHIWKYCQRGAQKAAIKITGACGNDHLIAWSGVASGWVNNIIALMSEVNSGDREEEKPRSICAKYKEAGSRFCVSWAAYKLQYMTQEEIDALSDHCWDNCQAINKSCEVSIAS